MGVNLPGGTIISNEFRQVDALELACLERLYEDCLTEEEKEIFSSIFTALQSHGLIENIADEIQLNNIGMTQILLSREFRRIFVAMNKDSKTKPNKDDITKLTKLMREVNSGLSSGGFSKVSRRRAKIDQSKATILAELARRISKSEPLPPPLEPAKQITGIAENSDGIIEGGISEAKMDWEEEKKAPNREKEEQTLEEAVRRRI